MIDFDTALEPLLAWERLLKPISVDSPSGVSLRNTPAYDDIPRSLRPPDAGTGGAAQRDARKTDYRALIRAASDLLAKQSKDLDIAVWLTEALVREHRLPGLSEGLLLIRRLLESFWDTVYPALDDGDEGFRAKPINRLNTAFIALLPHLPITFDGRTVHEYNAAAEIPSAQKAESSSDLRKKRVKALEDGVIPTEEIERSVQATSAQFYEEMAGEVQQARDAANLLQKTCDGKFKTDDRPILGKLLDQLERIRVTVEAVQLSKPSPQLPAGPPEMHPPQAAIPSVKEPAPVAAPLPPVVEAPTATPAMSEACTVVEIAAELRSSDPSNPVPYMLSRSWQFGPMIERGTVDEDTLAPPVTELRTALRRALLNSDWFEVLEQTERAMETPCGACWLDIQQHSSRACGELGYGGAARAIRGITAAYLRAVPDLPYAVMLDGSPTAAADTLVWIRTEVLADPEKARAESLEEVCPADSPRETAPGEPDAFEVAANELNAGRFSEAFRVLVEASVREHSGRGRIQRRIQLAKICMESGQLRIAAALLQEIFGVIEERSLATWETPEFVAPPMAMLYRCLEQLSENEELRRRIYYKLCSVDPARALELAVTP
jgi:type VI secretion system protein ImpA